MYAAFPLRAMEQLALAVVRVDYYGSAATEIISGAKVANTQEALSGCWSTGAT